MATTLLAQASRRWVERFESWSAQRGAGEPPAVQVARKAAIERFAVTGFPDRHQEAWKYTNLAPLARLDFEPLDANGARVGPQAALEALGLADTTSLDVLVGVNGGRLRPWGAAPEGVRLRDLVAAETEASPEAIAKAGPFLALNRAFFAEGAEIVTEPGVERERPLLLLFLHAGGTKSPTASHPRLRLRLAPGSRLSVIETHLAVDAGPHLINAATEAELGQGARLEHVLIQLPATGFRFWSFRCAQRRDSRLRSVVFALGATLVRNELEVALEEQGVECELDGLFAAHGGAHLDHHTTIDHQAPHGSSRELYKGILAERARGVFHGRIVVRPRAQRTDASQRNLNLLLSPGAEIDTKPQLEIYADDVRCNHGSAIGHLDQDALFYLRSRGLDPAAARALLTRGFAAEITARVAVPQLSEALERCVLESLFPQQPRRTMA